MLEAILISTGFVLRALSIYTLGHRFTLFIQSQSDIQTTGIYRLMRYPSYLGSMLIILGVSMVNEIAGIMTIEYKK